MHLYLLLASVAFALEPLLNPFYPVSRTPRALKPHHVPLLQRQVAGCHPDEDLCGDYCKNANATCCPDAQVACEIGTYCDMVFPGQYACCDNGELCSAGAGGSCDTDEKDCGLFCILSEDTCCPDGMGGCPPGRYCDLGEDGVYGCCDNGKVCQGSGNSPPLDFSIPPLLTPTLVTAPPPVTTIRVSTPPLFTVASPSPTTRTTTSPDVVVTVTATPSTATSSPRTSTRTLLFTSSDTLPPTSVSRAGATVTETQLSASSQRYVPILGIYLGISLMTLSIIPIW